MLAMVIPASADNTQTITITLDNYGTASILLNTNTWHPVCPLASSNFTVNNAFNLDNNGAIQVSVAIKAGNAESWTLGTTANHNVFALQYNLSSAWVGITGTNASFRSNLAYDQSQDFGMKIDMPTTSSVSTAQHITVTFTATAD